jgi:hypothetical protein
MNTTPTKIKTLRGYSAHARFCAELSAEPIGEAPSHLYPYQPYRYSQSVPVFDRDGCPVVVLETGHRQFMVFTAPRSIITPLAPTT